MFINATRSAAVSALAAGREVRINATGEILQLRVKYSKRACRRILSRWTDYYCEECIILGDPMAPITFSVRV